MFSIKHKSRNYSNSRGNSTEKRVDNDDIVDDTEKVDFNNTKKDHKMGRQNELTQEFKTFLKVNRSSSEKTIKSYLEDINSFFSFIELDVNSISDVKSISSDDIKSWLIERRKKCTNRTISRQIVSLKMYFLFLSEVKGIRNENVLNSPFPP